ncbi:MAG: chromosomal replication initiator protein DnaA [Patescibacteria group bacterium]|nr:chromosomal replication initiator protein DnaA [Patescibacteria group bacterium]
MNKEELWQATLGELELLISKANFTTWFKNTFISEYSEDKIVIGVPNAFTKTWLENKYHDFIIKAIHNITSHKIEKISYKVETRKPKTKIKEKVTQENDEDKSDKEAKEKQDHINKFNLNPKYTFSNFIVGKGNELAQAACSAVAEKPGIVYNPLFLYGGVGLGKTHLMQAIGNDIVKNHPKKKVIYVTCEKFTNEFIQTVSKGNAGDFKNTYRSVDILLIDDIQFLANKERTQEEFFHTFNTLHQTNKQIVVSSDRPPKSIPALEHRLVSRFEWGMIADIGQPDLETRIAILEKKCKEKNYKLKPEIINYIASNIEKNIRELEGALNRIIAYHHLNNHEPTLESTKKLLSSVKANPKKGGLTSKNIINIVMKFYDISSDNLMGSSRKKELVYPRQIAMYLLREELKSSYPSIGEDLGGRDHTTAMHACHKIAKLIEEDEKTKQDITLIKQRLYS